MGIEPIFCLLLGFMLAVFTARAVGLMRWFRCVAFAALCWPAAASAQTYINDPPVIRQIGYTKFNVPLTQGGHAVKDFSSVWFAPLWPDNNGVLFGTIGGLYVEQFQGPQISGYASVRFNLLANPMTVSVSTPVGAFTAQYVGGDTWYYFDGSNPLTWDPATTTTTGTVITGGAVNFFGNGGGGSTTAPTTVPSNDRPTTRLTTETQLPENSHDVLSAILKNRKQDENGGTGSSEPPERTWPEFMRDAFSFPGPEDADLSSSSAFGPESGGLPTAFGRTLAENVYVLFKVLMPTDSQPVEHGGAAFQTLTGKDGWGDLVASVCVPLQTFPADYPLVSSLVRGVCGLLCCMFGTVSCYRMTVWGLGVNVRSPDRELLVTSS